MSVAELFLVAVSLSMDAFAVSVCKGLAMGRTTLGSSALVGLWFGGFQALMPLAGYLLGSSFKAGIEAVDHWIAFGLLAIIGANMIRESLSKGEESCDPSITPKAMLPLALATSIDALAVGVSFAFLEVSILPAMSFIGVVTFLISGIGVKLGGVFGAKNRRRAEFCGGAVLVLLGLNILLEHLGVID